MENNIQYNGNQHFFKQDVTEQDIIEEITCIYSVYCKDENGITLLKKAYKSKLDACRYATNKITTLLNIIYNDFKNNSEYNILPVGAQSIYTLYNMKKGNEIEQYEYFKDHHLIFFEYVQRKPIMFYVSTLELI